MESVNKREFITSWTKEPFSPQIRKEAEKVLAKFDKNKSDADVEGYTVPLEFGTGGIRGVIGNGIGRMNEYTVGRAAFGFCSYLNKKYKNPSIAIAYDSRRRSKEFAEVTARIAAACGIKVKIFKEVAPTPMLSFAVRFYKAQGGVVITASHNPPEYNGFKAYLEDGGQLVPPDDGKIIKMIGDITDWNTIPLIPKSDPKYKKFVSFIDEKCFDDYKKQTAASGILSPNVSKKDRAGMKIVYSPLHGTGGKYMKSLLNHFGYKNVFLVPEQAKPDGEFPTVKYPNPEEPPALKLSEKHAKAMNADAFIATDPDADRLGIGVRHGNKYILLNGNQIGSIMAAYLCEKNTSKKKQVLVKTIVTTDLQEEIAKNNKVKFVNVLTGFKFIGAVMAKLDKSKTEEYLFGGEESYGYLPVKFVRDKDSLSSALLLLEILTEKKDLLGYLDSIYKQYGLYLEDLLSVTLKGEAGKKKIADSLEKLRNANLVGLKIGSRKILARLDYKTGKIEGNSAYKSLKEFPSSNVIQLEMEGGKLTIRPSGTEPKVKMYFSLKGDNSGDLNKGRSELKKEIDAMKKQFITMAGLS